MIFSKYNIVVEMEYGLLIFNVRTSNLVKLKNGNLVNSFKELVSNNNFDIKNPMVKALYDKEFIVDESVDEFELAKKKALDKYFNNEKIISITIHVTDNCNFNCSYCFQEHEPMVLSEKNWVNLYNYVEKRIISGNTDTICLTFYGGEPLLCKNKIIKFMQKVNKLSVQYPKTEIIYKMTTNGSLLTPKTYDELVECGLASIQITLDGSAENHNKTRPYADGSGSWDVIVENIRYINGKDDSCVVIIRTNFNNDTIDILDDFDKWFKDNFPNQKFLLVKQPIAKYSALVDDNILAVKDEKYYSVISERRRGNGDKLRPFGMACKFAQKGTFTVSSKGEISQCEESLSEQTIVGHLGEDGDIVYTKNFNEWCVNIEKKECKECMIYPLCVARSCCLKVQCDSLIEEFHQIVDRIKEGKIF